MIIDFTVISFFISDHNWILSPESNIDKFFFIFLLICVQSLSLWIILNLFVALIIKTQDYRFFKSLQNAWFVLLCAYKAASLSPDIAESFAEKYVLCTLVWICGVASLLTEVMIIEIALLLSCASYIKDHVEH
jgi:hypothetical protein